MSLGESAQGLTESLYELAEEARYYAEWIQEQGVDELDVAQNINSEMDSAMHSLQALLGSFQNAMSQFDTEVCEQESEDE